MKTVRKLSLVTLLLLSAFTAQTIYASSAPEKEKE